MLKKHRIHGSTLSRFAARLAGSPPHVRPQSARASCSTSESESTHFVHDPGICITVSSLINTALRIGRTNNCFSIQTAYSGLSPRLVPNFQRLIVSASTSCPARLGYNQGGWIQQVAPFSQGGHAKADGDGNVGGNCKLNSTESTATNTWIDRLLPARLKPFAFLARLDKPVGTWLLAWPCMWSITLASPPGSLPDIKMLALFGFGAILLRGAGCTVNDLLDQEIDKKVERTKTRPIAAGVLTTLEGVTFLGLQLLLGLGVLLQLNNFSQLLGASSLLLVGSYPLMKRWTFWPQAYLGLTFNWGVLLGWAAVRGSLNPSIVLPLYLSGICWTLVYDTIYAHQDKEDDAKVGVKSTALLFADQTQLWLSGFGATCISALTLAGFNSGIGWPFYVSMLAASGHLFWQIGTVNLHDRTDCNLKFVSNKWFGAIVFVGITSGKLIGS